MQIPYVQINLNTKNVLTRMGKKFVHASKSSLAILLAIGLNMTSFGFITETALAYYGDYEYSNDNSFTAAMLDFSISNNERDSYVGVEQDGDIDDFYSVVQQHPDSLDVQYRVDAELASSSNADFCKVFDFRIDHADFTDAKISDLNVNTNHSIAEVTRSTTTEMGTWDFTDIDLTDDAMTYPHGVECNVDLVFTGWRDGIATPEESGYTDEERIKLRLKNRMVVMNEFLPNPDTDAHGLDYGDDSDDKPNGEWVELYNNSEVPHDISGWFIKDAADNVVSISAGNTDPATTTVPAKGWLVVYMNKAFLNNDGDTIMLKDDSGEIVDEYTYDGGDYCEQEPTPNATNTTSATGDCSDVPPNKSYARIPDGTGGWVDPIPTPGSENTKEQPEIATTTADVAGTSTEVSTGTSTATTTSTTTATDTSTSTDDTASSTEDSGADSAESDNGAGNTDSTSSNNSEDEAASSTASSTDKTASSTNATSTDDGTETEEETATSTDETASSTASSTQPQATSTDDTVNNDSPDGDTTTTSDPIESEEKATSTDESDVDEGDSDAGDDDGTSSDSDTSGENEDVTEDEPDTQQTNEPIESEEKTKQSEDEQDAGTNSSDDGSDDTDGEDDTTTQDDSDSDSEESTGDDGSVGGEEDTSTDDTSADNSQQDE